ncbi:MopE-related protein, partial [Flavobacterium stagni]
MRANFHTLKRKQKLSCIIHIQWILIFFSTFALAQRPTVLYTSLSATTPASSNARFTLNTLTSSHKQIRFQSQQTLPSGNATWAFHQGTTATPDYTNCWRPYTANNVLSANTFIPVGFANGARYNSSSGGVDGQLPAITNGNYYTFNVTNNATSDNLMQLLETNYNPVLISGVAQTSGTYGSRVVTITTSGIPNAAENIFIRYSTNAYVSSTLIQATGSGTTWTATIPWQAAAVSFYAYTSNKTITEINADVASYGQSAHLMSTLNLNNNGGSNYSWTPATGNYIVSSTTGSASANSVGYATLTTPTSGLFDVLNGGVVHTGLVTVLVTGNATEPGTAGLNNSTLWTSLTIRPNGARTISGSPNAGIPLLLFNGADNVTIDGLNSNGNSLVISNLTVATNFNTSTLNFVNDASNNLITNCSVLGSGTNFGTATIIFRSGSSTGNDNNTISKCLIGPAGANLPSYAIYSDGGTATANSGNTISQNEIFDYFSSTNFHGGVVISGGNTGWVISNNYFYQTTSRNIANTQVAINISGTTTSRHEGALITGNVIGFSNRAGTGNYTLNLGNSGKFYPIRMSNHSTSIFTTISNNSIRNIALTGSSTGAFTSAPFIGISSNTGSYTILNNTIGSLVENDNITLVTSNGATATDFIGIFNNQANLTIDANSVGGITISNTSTASTAQMGLYGMYSTLGATYTITFTNNILGGTTAHSIQNLSNLPISFVYGLYNFNAKGQYSNNIIRNLTGFGGGSLSLGALTGMYFSGDNLPTTIAQNQIYNLTNQSTGISAEAVKGIFNRITSSSQIISKNSIYNLNAPLLTNATIIGIDNGATPSTNTISNNWIRLGIDSAGNSINNDYNFIAIRGNGGNLNLYHNSIYIGGQAVTGSVNTACYQSTTTNFHNVIAQNNIFYNTRNNGTGTGKHFAVQFTNPPASYTFNNNCYFVNGNGGTVGFLNTNLNSLLDWQLATNQEANGVNGDPQFVGATNLVPDFHINASIPTVIESSGVVIGTVTDDFDGNSRSGLTPSDIGAFAGNFTSAISPCGIPAQPTNFSATGSTTTSVSGAFVGISEPNTSYLIVRSIGALTGFPVDGTIYTVGNSLGNGTVIQRGSSTTISQTGLIPNTSYQYTIFPYLSVSCTGGAKYNTINPLSGILLTCPLPPTSPTISMITNEGARIAWIGATGMGTLNPVNYSVEIYTNATFTTPVLGSPFNAGTATNYIVNGLLPNTAYYVRIKSNNGYCESAYLNGGSFLTNCITSNLNSTQGFNQTSIPNCWRSAIVPIGGTATVLQPFTRISYLANAALPTTTAQEGTHFVQYDAVNQVSGGEERLISLPFSTIGITSVDLEFFWRNQNAAAFSTGAFLNEGVQIEYSFDGSSWVNIGPFIRRHESTLAAETAQWIKKTLSMSVIGNQQQVFIAFKFHSSAGQNLFIDNVILRETPDPIVVTPSSPSICSGSFTSLVATSTANYTYTWSPSTGLSATSGASVIANPTSTTTYTVTGVLGNKYFSQEVVVTVNPLPPSVTLNTTSTSICQNGIVPMTASSFTQSSVQIGAGVGVNTSITPYRQTTNNARNQYLITKAELNAAGITTASEITSIGFNVTAAGSGIISSYTISLANTTATSLTSNYLTPTYTAVTTRTNFTVTTGINSYNFATPFNWDGTSNILVNVCHTGTVNSSATVRVTGFATNLTAISTGANTCTALTGATVSTFRPNIHLTVKTNSPITWSPTTGLFINAAATTAYTGTATTTVYAKPSATTTYTATSTLGSCTSTNSTLITVQNNTAIVTHPVSQTVCIGEPVTFSVTVANSLGGYLYQWRKNGNSIPGAINNTYTIPSVSNADAASYSVEVLGDCGPVVISYDAQLTVNPLIPVAVSISTLTNTILMGTSVTFSATPTNGGTNPLYQWAINGNPIAGATNDTFITSTLNDGDSVTVTLISNASLCIQNSPAISDAIIMNVNQVPPASVSIATATSTICAGTVITFTATSLNEGTTPTYQWQVNGINQIGENGTTFITSNLNDGDEVTVILSPTIGIPVQSNTISILVNPITSVGSETISTCDTYTWPANGQTYTSSGVYTHTAGCNIATLNLTITPSTTNGSITTTACDSYTWAENGETYTSTGVYTNTVGCNTATLNLTIAPSSSNTISVTACDSYTWSINGQTYTTSGTYTYQVGCVNEELVLTILPLQTYYADADNDGFGNASSSIQACAMPFAYVTNNTDCDDTRANVNPGAVDVCYDGLDNDCNGNIDNIGLPGGCIPIYTVPAPTVPNSTIAQGATVLTSLVANAQGYRFRVTRVNPLDDSPISATVIVDMGLRNLFLSNLSIYAYGSKYKVETTVLINNVWQPNYAPAFYVFTPTPLSTVASCGTQISNTTSQVTSSAVALVSVYRYQVQRLDASNNVVSTQVLTSGLRYFSF